MVKGKRVPWYIKHPVYCRVTLRRTLTHRNHLEKLQKISTVHLQMIDVLTAFFLLSSFFRVLKTSTLACLFPCLFLHTHMLQVQSGHDSMTCYSQLLQQKKRKQRKERITSTMTLYIEPVENIDCHPDTPLKLHHRKLMACLLTPTQMKFTDTCTTRKACRTHVFVSVDVLCRCLIQTQTNNPPGTKIPRER